MRTTAAATLVTTTARAAIITASFWTTLAAMSLRTRATLLALGSGSTAALIATARRTVAAIAATLRSFGFALVIGVAVLVRRLLCPGGQKVQVQVKIGLWCTHSWAQPYFTRAAIFAK